MSYLIKERRGVSIMTRRVGFLLFDYVDLLDFSGPAEVLSLTTNSKAEQALTLYKKKLLPTRPFEIITFSKTGASIKTHAGITVEPDYSIDEEVHIDILIIPGGPLRAIQSLAKNKRVINWLKQYKDAEFICTVCTGTYILGATDLLSGKRVTTHHLATKLVQET